MGGCTIAGHQVPARSEHFRHPGCNLIPIDNLQARKVVAVIGGATAGSEVAHILAQRGAVVAVIEQNPRPYGKIEDGLPRWHVKQRRDEYEEINSRLDHPEIE